MPRPIKTRVCSETEKRKAEIFNKIDELIQTGRWNEAASKLHYLYRNAPSVRQQVQRKLAWLYFETKNYYKSLTYLQELIPTTDNFINKMVIECLLKLDKKYHALFHLARLHLPPTKKRAFFFLIFPELQENLSNKADLKDSQITIRCHNCTRFVFFTDNRPRCLFCNTFSVK
ncbi:MAG: hypothetical protein JSW11_05285 [Candidatus Heimdallarchaeota archaeon]|nr:MAG: hypothetical protein JSW11_05285 [Candidatus Heimdallarchaeota archaeon]